MSATALSVLRHFGFGNRYNMADIWEFPDDSPLDVERFRVAVTTVLQWYPAMCSALSTQRERFTPAKEPVHVHKYDLRGEPDPESIVTRITSTQQGAFKHDGNCPLMFVAVFQLDHKQYLYLQVSHFFVDGYSYRMFLSEIERCMDGASAPRLDDGQSIEAWNRAIVKRCACEVDETVQFWRATQTPAYDPERASWRDTSGPSGSAAFVVKVSHTTATRLLHWYGTADLGDLILLALAAQFGTNGNLLVDVLSACRGTSINGCDAAQAMALVAEFIPTPLSVDVCDPLRGDALQRLRGLRAGLPCEGIGFRAFREFEPLRRLSAEMGSFHTPRVMFNNIMPIQEISDHEFLGKPPSDLPVGDRMTPHSHYWLVVNVGLSGGEIAIQFDVVTDKVDLAMVKDRAAALVDLLTGLAL